MKKTLSIIFLILIWPTISFAFNEYENAMYQGCLETSQHLGSKRAKQYCRCTTIMVFDKYSINQLEEIALRSQKEQIEILGFAINYCNRNARAPGD
tara:strand:- start:6 stop:293 length:288 start_codon:yes stop_codon:yes gene_type:complete